MPPVIRYPPSVCYKFAEGKHSKIRRQKMNYAPRIAPVLNISARRVEAVIELLETGATIPFIARYRKEATGELDEVQIADIQDSWKKMM